MGFNETHSFQAAKKHDNNINKAIQFIKEKQQTTTKTSKKSYKDRIDYILKLNDAMDEHNDEYKGQNEEKLDLLPQRSIYLIYPHLHKYVNNFDSSLLSCLALILSTFSIKFFT